MIRIARLTTPTISASMFMEEIFEKYYDSIEKLMDESEEIKTTYDAKITEEERKLGELKTQESLMVIGSKLKEEKREERKRVSCGVHRIGNRAG